MQRVGFTLLVAGGGEKEYGGATEQQMRSFDDLLVTPDDPRETFDERKPHVVVCEFEFTSPKEPIRWLWELSDVAAAKREEAGRQLANMYDLPKAGK